MAIFYMVSSYTLVLTGKVLPGYAPESVWPKLAARVGMEPDKLMQLVARAPRIIKQDGSLSKLQAWQSGLAKIGAQTELCPPDERPALFVLLDGTPRGPIPRLMVELRVKQGQWADSISVAEAGATGWKPYRELDARGVAPRPAPPRLSNRSASSAVDPEEPESGGVLPPGKDIHAGFWRRGAALALDSSILLIPSLMVPLIG
jgi:hypothetical protein